MRLTANLEDRTITGLALPFGEEGRTNLGRVTASAGSVAVPDDVSAITLNLEHARTAPVGRATAVEETPEGLVATFRVARTRAGDDLLAEVAEGLRAGLSVELDDPVIRGGRLLSGALSAVAAVVAPAFPSALLTAADAGDVEDDEDETTDGETVPEAAPAPAAGENTDEGEKPEDTEEEEKVMASAATVPAGSLLASKALKAEGDAPALPTLFARLAAAGATMQPSRLLAALDEVTAADAFAVTNQPQYVGELWAGKSYVEKYAPLVGHANLTGPKVTGWRFVSGKAPTVAAYNGFPTQPTSNEVDTEAVEATVARIAGGWALDRVHRDFPSEEFWRAFFAAATEDYAKKRDAAVLAALVAGSTAVTVGTVPSGVAEAAVKIVDGALAMIDYATPTFAVVGSDLWREFLLTRREDSLEYIGAALGIEDGALGGFRIVPTSSASLTNKVLVGSREAMTLHELPGSPIRIDAESISTGGVETGLFGYYATIVHNSLGLRLVADA